MYAGDSAPKAIWGESLTAVSFFVLLEAINRPITMPTSSKKRRAPQAKVKQEEKLEEPNDFDGKENDAALHNDGGGAKRRRDGAKRRRTHDDSAETEDNDEVNDNVKYPDKEDEPEEKEENENDDPPIEASPKKTKKTKHSIISSPLRERHLNPSGKPAEAGIIHEVYVENFMCHRKLTVKLCRNVNFIHGQNGSGKSAILAAIQVCLGAGARRTHRARNLKDLVRKEAGADCSGARLRVKLLNRGADGFQPEVYGDFITV